MRGKSQSNTTGPTDKIAPTIPNQDAELNKLFMDDWEADPSSVPLSDLIKAPEDEGQDYTDIVENATRVGLATPSMEYSAVREQLANCITNIPLLTRTEIGAQHWPDLSFADQSPSADNIRHIAINGNDGNDGLTMATAWKTITHAARTLRAGQAGYIHQGTYPEQRISTRYNGTSKQPIWLMAAPGEQVRITKPGTPAADAPFLVIKNSYWIVAWLEIDAAGQKGHAIRFEGCDHTVVRNVHAHDGTGPAAVAITTRQTSSGQLIGSKDVGLFTSHIHGYTFSGGDSHGVVVRPNSARVLIRRNHSHNNAGDSVQCVGFDDAPPGTQHPRDIWILENRYHHDRENAVDLKTCNAVTVRQNKFYGYRPVSSAPGGDAIVVHKRASSILIEKNRIWDCGRAASIGATSGAGAGQLGPVVFRRNLIFDASTAGPATGAGIRANQVRRAAPRPVLEIYHNTFYNVPDYAIRLCDDNGPMNQAVIINNIIAFAGTVFDIRTNHTPPLALTSDRNLFWPDPPRIVHNSQVVSLATWQQRGYDPCSNVADPMFIANPRSNDFYTQAGSAARDVAYPIPSNVTIEPVCFAGPDIGFLETCS